MFRQLISCRLMITVAFYLATGCQGLERQRIPHVRTSMEDAAIYYQSQILSDDTSSKTDRLTKTRNALFRIRHSAQPDNPYFTFFLGREHELAGQKDSALYYYRQLEGDTSDVNLYSLVQYSLFDLQVNAGEVVEADRVAILLKTVWLAERKNSLFLYRLYEALAKSYFSQKDIGRSIEYTNLYFDRHPFRWHPLIRQRYYDISFMLASQVENREAMRRHLDSARSLALQLRDTLALIRTYDYEAQVYSYDNPVKALYFSRKFYKALQSRGRMEMYAYNNLATTFELNGQLDSAAYYYNEAVNWAKHHPETNLSSTYESLESVYKKLGKYKDAVRAMDSALKIFTFNTKRTQADRVEELKARYQAEKKDQAIASLQARTELNRRIIRQQQWFFAGGTILFITVGLYMYNRYRRKLLQEKNEKLSVENRRLRLEQKTLQLQLNPHFIYNSIANLQGLINQGNKKEASMYLSSFSHLMRAVLELNREDYVTIREEIETLESYIRLQQMRFKNVFDYHIEIQLLDIDEILIPPMLLQPLVENSIEHGFKNMNRKGRLTITFKLKGEHLHIDLLDNGNGESGSSKPIKKSLSQSITRERLDVLFNREGHTSYLDTQQLSEPDKGYHVHLAIPLLTT